MCPVSDSFDLAARSIRQPGAMSRSLQKSQRSLANLECPTLTLQRALCCRSQRTKTDDIYVEMSLFDLEQQYSGTQAGRLGTHCTTERASFVVVCIFPLMGVNRNWNGRVLLSPASFSYFILLKVY